MTSEKQVQDAIFDYLLYRGYLVIRINSGAMTKEEDSGAKRFIRFVSWQVLGEEKRDDGVSDLLALSPDGRLLAVEVKRPGRRDGKNKDGASDSQNLFLTAVRERGGVGIVADSLEAVQHAVDNR